MLACKLVNNKILLARSVLKGACIKLTQHFAERE